MNLLDAIDHQRLVVCVGTGGVGKTTVAAAIALAAAQRGRRAIVLAIDPARALARALGLDRLAAGGQLVPAAALADAGLAPSGVLSAAMLDQKQAWDAFVSRHAPSSAVATALLANPFYQRLSTSFAGSTEYMAIEEMCRLSESTDYDLVVLDTPPSAHAVDFLRAPERIDRLLATEANWFASPVRFVARQLERAAGAATLHDIATFFAALRTLIDGIRDRTRRARALLHDGTAAFVLVAGPREATLDDTTALAERLRELSAPLAAVIVNRVTALPAIDPAIADAELAALGDSIAADWVRDRWRDVIEQATAQARLVAPFLASLPIEVERAILYEADHDVHSLRDLAAIAHRVTSKPTSIALTNASSGGNPATRLVNAGPGQ